MRYEVVWGTGTTRTTMHGTCFVLKSLLGHNCVVTAARDFAGFGVEKYGECLSITLFCKYDTFSIAMPRSGKDFDTHPDWDGRSRFDVDLAILRFFDTGANTGLHLSALFLSEFVLDLSHQPPQVGDICRIIGMQKECADVLLPCEQGGGGSLMLHAGQDEGSSGGPWLDGCNGVVAVHFGSKGYLAEHGGFVSMASRGAKLTRESLGKVRERFISMG